MTISTDHVTDVFDSNGGNRYDVDWQVRKSGGLAEVIVTIIAADGTEGNPLSQGTDYTIVVDETGEGATLFFSNPPPTGVKIKIKSNRPYTQESHFTPGASVDPIQLEGNLDDNVIQHLQLFESLEGKVNTSVDPATGKPAKITIETMKAGHVPVYQIEAGGSGGRLMDSGFSLGQFATDKWIKAPIDKDWVLVSQANPDSPTGFAYVPHSINEFATDSWINAPSAASKVLVSGPSSTSFSGFQYNEAPLSGFITTADMVKPNGADLVPVSVADSSAPSGYKYSFLPKTSFVTTGELQPAVSEGKILISKPDSSSSTGFSYKESPQEFSWIKPPSSAGKTVSSTPDPASPTGFSYVETSSAAKTRLDSTGIIKGLGVTSDGVETVTVAAGNGIFIDTDGVSTPIELKTYVSYVVPITKDGYFYIYLDSSGNVSGHYGHPDPSEFYTRIFLGIAEIAGGRIVSLTPYRLENRNALSSAREMFDFYGPATDCSLLVSPNANAPFELEPGMFVRFGVEEKENTPECHSLKIAANPNTPFRFVYGDGTGGVYRTSFDGSLLPSENIKDGTKSDIPRGEWGVYPITLTPDGRLDLAVSWGSSATPAGLQSILDFWPSSDIFRRNAYIGFIALQSGVSASSWLDGHIFVANNKLSGGRLPSSSSSVRGSAEGITDANSVITGLVMTEDTGGTTFSVSAGEAMFIDPADLAAGPKIVKVNAVSGINVPRISDTDYSFIYLKKDGSYEVGQTYVNTARGDRLFLGVLEHTDNTEIRFIRHLGLNSDAIPKQIYDLYGMIGNVVERAFIEKSVVSTNGFASFAGKFKGFGVDPSDRLAYSETDLPAQDPTPFRIRKLDGSQSAVLTALTDNVITELDDGTPLKANNFCYLPVFVYPTGKMYLQAPQVQFPKGSTPTFDEWYGKYKFESALTTNGSLRAILKYNQGTALDDAANIITIVTDKGFGSLPSTGGGGISPNIPTPNPDGSDLSKVLQVVTGNVYGLGSPSIADPSAAGKSLLSSADAASPTGFKYKEASGYDVAGIPTPDAGGADLGKTLTVGPNQLYALAPPPIADPSAADKILLSSADSTSSTGFKYKEAAPIVPPPTAADKIPVSIADGSGGFRYDVLDKSSLALPLPTASDQILLSKPSATSPTGFVFEPASSFATSRKLSYPPMTNVFGANSPENMFPYFLSDILTDTLFAVEIEIGVNAWPTTRVNFSAACRPYVGKKIGLSPTDDADHYSLTSGGNTMTITPKKVIAKSPVIKSWYLLLERDPEWVQTELDKRPLLQPAGLSNGQSIDFGVPTTYANHVEESITLVLDFEVPVLLVDPQSTNRPLLTSAFYASSSNQNGKVFEINTGYQTRFTLARDGSKVLSNLPGEKITSLKSGGYSSIVFKDGPNPLAGSIYAAFVMIQYPTAGFGKIIGLDVYT